MREDIRRKEIEVKQIRNDWGFVKMAIGSVLSAHGDNKLVILYPGKMFKSSISKTDKALCFVINKGYIETTTLNSMLSILDEFKKANGVVIVGKIEKVRKRNTDIIVYRQRLFFKSIKIALSLCKVFGMQLELGKDFHVTINNILNCVDDLVFLERYSAQFDEPIDAWLTNCCVIHLHYLLLNMQMNSNLGGSVEKILKGRVGYLDRAPFLVASYNIDNHSSSIFLELDTSDKRLYSKDIHDKLYIEYGYTDDNIREDMRKGVF